MTVLDPQTGDVLFVSAGAEPPLVIRAGGDAKRVGSRGMALGIQPQDADFHFELYLLLVL